MSISASSKERSPGLTFFMMLPEALLYFALGAATIIYAWRPVLEWAGGKWQEHAFWPLVLSGIVVVVALGAAGWLSSRIGILRSFAVFILAVGVLAFFLTGFGVHLPAG